MPTVANIAGAFAVHFLMRNYLRGRGITFVSLGVTLRRGYRKHAGARPILRKASRI